MDMKIACAIILVAIVLVTYACCASDPFDE